jgi:hypothetical protein
MLKDDPVNPKHYDGTACADIGERLTANSYQVLKYNWRLGKKDDPVIEIGKSIWYLDREIAMAADGFEPPELDTPDEFFSQRLFGQDQFVQTVAIALIAWNRYGDKETLNYLRKDLLERKAQLEAAHGGSNT